MNTVRSCGCKGVRTCLQCERDFDIVKPKFYKHFHKAWVYCPLCASLYQGWETQQILENHPNHNGDKGIAFAGILIQQDFLSANEACDLMRQLDELPWAISQSGRRKQNFGPKTNFKKRKLQNGTFNGFPAFTKFIQERFHKRVPLLHDFQTIEQCSLEYDPAKGASIDPHIDDCWIWGERVVTVNCCGDAVLTMSLYEPNTDVRKYNLDLVEQYLDKLRVPLESEENLRIFRESVIRIPMPNLSLIVLYGPARYQFEHSVLREDIKERRVCIAYREFTPFYIEGNDREKGRIITKISQNFW